MSARPEVMDLVVAGSGAAGFTAAITARRAGLEVLLLEKQPELGGTTARSGTWIWIPNNRPDARSGLVDARDDALRYMARLARPDSYDADHPTLGLPADEHEMLAAFYDYAGPALDELAAAGAIDPVRAIRRAGLLRRAAGEQGSLRTRRRLARSGTAGSADGAASSSPTSRRRRGDSACGSRPASPSRTSSAPAAASRAWCAATRRIAARRGVVFATGGFAHSQNLMTRFVPMPLRATGASAGSEGDFLRIGMRLGAQLRNMAEAWLAPIPIEPYVADPARSPRTSSRFAATA